MNHLFLLTPKTRVLLLTSLESNKIWRSMYDELIISPIKRGKQFQGGISKGENNNPVPRLMIWLANHGTYNG